MFCTLFHETGKFYILDVVKIQWNKYIFNLHKPLDQKGLMTSFAYKVIWKQIALKKVLSPVKIKLFTECHGQRVVQT